MGGGGPFIEEAGLPRWVGLEAKNAEGGGLKAKSAEGDKLEAKSAEAVAGELTESRRIVELGAARNIFMGRRLSNHPRDMVNVLQD
jgi:hypothetical protein